MLAAAEALAALALLPFSLFIRFDNTRGEIEMERKYRYDPSRLLPYPLYRCDTCGAEVLSGGEDLHKRGCAVAPWGFASFTMVFGPGQAEGAKRVGVYGENTPWYDLTLKILREKFPELVE